MRGKCFVRSVELDQHGNATALAYADGSARGPASERRLDGLDGVVLALGAKGMRAVVGGSPELAAACPELCKAASLGAIDVLACRIWLDSYVPTLEPANVLSRFPGLLGAGGTFFMLDQLQREDEALLWAGETPQGSVVACDVYDAGAVSALSDDDIINLFAKELLPAAVPAFEGANVVDAHVQRYPGAVSFFSPGSYDKRPPLQTSVPNVLTAGDWVGMGEREHGSKGLCQERAYVSGIEAANALLAKLGRGNSKHHVIPVRDDEPQFAYGEVANRAVAQALAPLGVQPPWLS